MFLLRTVSHLAIDHEIRSWGGESSFRLVSFRRPSTCSVRMACKQTGTGTGRRDEVGSFGVRNVLMAVSSVPAIWQRRPMFIDVALMKISVCAVSTTLQTLI